MSKRSLRNKDFRSRISLLFSPQSPSLPFHSQGGASAPRCRADLALRIRLDDTLTSTDSQVGDPFSATVVDRGSDRRRSGLRTRQQHYHLGQTEGQHDHDAALRSAGYARWTSRTHPRGAGRALRCAVWGRKSTSKGRSQSGGRGRTSAVHTAIGAGAGALLGGIFGGGKGAGIGSIVGGAGGLGTTVFHGHQKISLNSGLEMLIRTTG